MLNSLEMQQRQLERAQQQVSSGLRITRASDEPQTIGALLETRSDIARVTQIGTNLGAVKNEVDTAESGLETAVQMLEKAGVLATQGTNISVTDSQRATLAEEVSGIIAQLVGVSRTQVNGKYIFSGDDTGAAPYDVDPSSATGVKQLVDSGSTRLIQDASGLTFAVSKTAQEIFDARDGNGNPAAGNVFAALEALKTALLANDTGAIESAAAQIDTAHDYLGQQLGFYGGVQARISTAIDLAKKFEVDGQTRLSAEQDADIAAAALAVTQANTQINATLASASKMRTTSLFDYFR